MTTTQANTGEAREDPLFALETQVNEITTASDAETVIDLMGKLEWLMSRSREIKKLFEDQLMAWIDANGDIEIGTVRYYVGNKKTDKCRDIPGTVTALLDVTGGDVSAFCDVLSANAIKVGAVRKLLAQNVFAELFETSIEKDLKTGSPVKTVHRVDSRFVKTSNGNVPEGSDL